MLQRVFQIIVLSSEVKEFPICLLNPLHFSFGNAITNTTKNNDRSRYYPNCENVKEDKTLLDQHLLTMTKAQQAHHTPRPANQATFIPTLQQYEYFALKIKKSIEKLLYYVIVHTKNHL